MHQLFLSSLHHLFAPKNLHRQAYDQLPRTSMYLLAPGDRNQQSASLEVALTGRRSGHMLKKSGLDICLFVLLRFCVWFFMGFFGGFGFV